MPLETVIHTIRHGRTDFNVEKRYSGTIDVPLNENGVREIRESAHGLAKYSFDVVVTSTLQRAVETARILVNNKVPDFQTPLCNERNFGILEGKTWDDVLKMDPPILMIEVGNDLHTVNPPGAEPFEDIWLRARKFRRFLFRQFSGKNILVVSHGVFLQLFNGLLSGHNCIESLAIYPSNLELFSFHFRGNRLFFSQSEKLTRDVSNEKF